jgi:curli biogenesis system outer membrane secretion channel CsgG
MISKLQKNAAVKAITVLTIAAASTSVFAQSNVEKCATPLGSISVIEAPGGYGYLSSYRLGSPSALLRLMIQQSGCFDVVERGAAFTSLQQERSLAGSGELQQGSNIGKGQLQAADFVMTPNIQVSGDTGGIGGAVAGLGRMLGGVGATIGGLVGGIKFKEAQTSLLIADVRSGLQVAAAEGVAKKTDFSIGGWGYGAGTWGGGGGYTTTPEGKMISASLLDNYNNVVKQVREKPQLIKQRSASSAANAAGSIQATNQTPNSAPAQQLAPVQAAPTQASSVRVSTSNYAGSFSGADQGTFAVSIQPSGQISGSGNSPSTGRFFISGLIDPSGNLSMSTSGSAAGASFSGFIEPSTGELKGIWSTSNPSIKGSFTGTKM